MWVIGTVGLIHKQLSQDVLEFVDLYCKHGHYIVNHGYECLACVVCVCLHNVRDPVLELNPSLK